MNMQEHADRIHPLVRELLARQQSINMTNKELATISGYDISYIQSLHTGRRYMPNIFAITDIAEALGLTLALQSKEPQE